MLWDEEKPFLVASPDDKTWEGQVRRLLFEIKYPYKNTDWKTPVHYSIPEYYIPKIIIQMGTPNESLGYYVHESIFVSLSEESSTAFTIRFDKIVWDVLSTEANVFYKGDDRTRPLKKKEIGKKHER